MNTISIRKRIADTVVFNENAKLLLHVWSYDFYDTALSTKQQRRYMIK